MVAFWFCTALVLLLASTEASPYENLLPFGHYGSSELCHRMDCKNEGFCHEGFCLCQPGYHGTSCEKSDAYLPDGPQVNVPVATLTAGGWTQCHKELYSKYLDNNNIEEIRNKCHREKVFVGCKKVGSDRLTVAAWGKRTTVFMVTDGNPKCKGHCKSKNEAGTKWYRTPKAWGFAAPDNDLYLDHADVGDTSGPAPKPSTAGTRLSWHSTLPVGGGYRCGANKSLNSSNAWERVIFHAN